MEYKVKDKYLSMVRSYKRLEKISTDNDGTISFAGSQDQVEDFFNQCYHFKDWLIKDPGVALSKKSVEEFISDSPSLSLAADICNSFKHAGLDKRSRSGRTLEGMKRHLSLLVPRGEKLVTFARHELTIGGKQYDAFSLATECLGEWEKYLKENKIQVHE
jgi:hypothetical protein